MIQHIKKLYNKIYQREYRPNAYFRAPIYVIGLYFAIKAKHPFFFSAINPDIPWMWFLDDAKTDTYKLLEPRLYPQSVEISIPISHIKLQWYIKDSQLVYPMIIKPNWDSVRWNDVYYIVSPEDRTTYLTKLAPNNYLIQEYITWEEYSIYYCCYPNHSSGNILGITKKIYPTITWDWISTIGQLIQSHKRYHRYYLLFRDTYHIDMNEVLPSWVSKQIATIWNHSKWSMFLDRSSYISNSLVQVIDNIFDHNVGVHLFRLDIKTQSRDKLLEWNFKIIESNNGVFAEPTYMYDPDYKLINAYKQIYNIRNHWYHIATHNYKHKNIQYLPRKQWRTYSKSFFTTR